MPSRPAEGQHVQRVPSRGQIHQTLAVAAAEELGVDGGYRSPSGWHVPIDISVDAISLLRLKARHSLNESRSK